MNNELPNTTILLAGRPEEGELVFQLLREKAAQVGDQASLHWLDLKEFSEDEIVSYFDFLAEEWEQQALSMPDDLRIDNIARAMRQLADEHDTLKVLKLYTEGQPVRLALYADLIVNGRPIPAALTQSYSMAVKALGTDKKEHSKKLELARKDIEREFINALFDKPGRQAEILKALVRVERELSVEQLHFLLDSPVGITANRWQENSEKLEETRQDLDEMRALSIVKTMVKDDGDALVTLQDEIYRIYADVMLIHEGDRTDEQQARRRLYTQLEWWAAHILEKLMRERAELQNADESGLRIDLPTQSLSVHFPTLDNRANQQRRRLRVRIEALEIERMYYALLVDPLVNFNDDYCSLADTRWLASNEDGMAVVQAETWRILTRHEAIRFVDLSLPRHPTNPEALRALRRAAQQENVIRWMKTFIIRQDFERALIFSAAIDQMILQLSDDNDRRSWQHTFSTAERACWRGYAQIYKGEEIDTAVTTITPFVQKLVELVDHAIEEMVFPERDEKGFRGHPAESRLRRSIAITYNVIGYGYATKGLFRKAVENYGFALRYVRDTNFLALQATVRNNLARVLSELGRTERGRRICSDGLRIRREEGAEVPIAYSLNTLALIDNDALRPDLAWIEVATAMAYFRQVGDERGRGLALIQLGEALRRLANGNQTGRRLTDPPERILDTAAVALREALEIFQRGAPANENPRQIEILNELGCLYRDRLRLADLDQMSNHKWGNYQDAIFYLQEAVQAARRLKLPRLEMDALVNMAWAHYYSGEIDAIEPTLHQVEQTLEPECFLREGKLPPSPYRDDSYIFFYLSKSFGLRGRLSMDRFLKRVEELKQSFEHDKFARHKAIHMDDEAQVNLKEAATYFIQSLSYAQLFSPRSSALAVTYDQIYDYLKRFNATELEDFQHYQHAAHSLYSINKLEIQDFSNLEVFIDECFGKSQ